MAHGHDNSIALQVVSADETGLIADDFEAFARAQRVSLLKYFRSHLPTEADAQDAAQETLLRFLRYREEPVEAWQPLLFRIGTNVVGEFYRRREVRHAEQHVPLASVSLPSEASEHEERIEGSQRKALLREALLTLTPRSRQIYLLSRVDGLSYPQIAKRCGITVKSVEKSIGRTVDELTRRVGAGCRRASY